MRWPLFYINPVAHRHILFFDYVCAGLHINVYKCTSMPHPWRPEEGVESHGAGIIGG